jgi:hypothetical protein
MAVNLLTFGMWYLYAGGVVAIVFLTFGLNQMDENARGAWIFRPLLIPGVLLIWPLVLWRWFVLKQGETLLDRHRMPRIKQERITLVFSILIPIIIIVALYSRQNSADLPAPVLLEAVE